MWQCVGYLSQDSFSSTKGSKQLSAADPKSRKRSLSPISLFITSQNLSICVPIIYRYYILLSTFPAMSSAPATRSRALSLCRKLLRFAMNMPTAAFQAWHKRLQNQTELMISVFFTSYVSASMRSLISSSALNLSAAEAGWVSATNVTSGSQFALLSLT